MNFNKEMSQFKIEQPGNPLVPMFIVMTLFVLVGLTLKWVVNYLMALWTNRSSKSHKHHSHKKHKHKNKKRKDSSSESDSESDSSND